MVSINNSNNSRSYGSSGILGLSSGIDSESVIEGMLAKTQLKIDKQLGLKQQILWKQEIYRDIISDIQGLQRKFFDTLNPKSNLLSKSFYSTQTVTSSSSSVQASSNQTSSSEMVVDYISQLATGTKLVSQSSVTKDIQLNVDHTKILDSTSINVMLDGVSKTIKLYGSTNEELLINLQDDLTKSFGSGITVALNGEVTTSNARQLSINGTSENLEVLGLTTKVSNRVDLSMSLKDLSLKQALTGPTFNLTINGVDFSFNETQTVREIIETINQSKANVNLSYSNIGDKFTLSSKTLGQGVQIEFEEEGNLLDALFKVDTTTYQIVDGKNAILSVNGVEIERNSNNFEVNQFKLVLQSTTATKTNLSAKNSTEQVVEGITKFVDDYNKLIDKIYALTTEKSEYREYSPLTDKQRDEMSETEIEQWEKKAKTGLVRSDTNLVSLITELRQIMFTQPMGISISLNEIGLSSGSYADRGKLSIDSTKLNSVLENRMDEVQAFFSTKENGVAVKFNSILNKNAQSSLSSPGRLVSVAGVKNTSSDVKNSLNERIRSIELSINNLRRMYDTQKDRYWKQFTNLESAMSKMNSQSSWLTQQLG
jgi:flagellar hook-associated protein 2